MMTALALEYITLLSPPLPTDGLTKARILVAMTYGKNSVATTLCNLGVHHKAPLVTTPIKAKELYLR